MPNDASAPSLPKLITPLILCGGSGTRLWPASNSSTPKQLLSLAGTDTLLQATARRISGELFEPPIIVTQESFALPVAQQLAAAGVQPSKILLEPLQRNTAPAIAAAAVSELLQHHDPLLLAMPSDHVILNVEAFTDAVRLAIPAANSGEIVTFGVRPVRAETGYGYIEVRPQEEPGSISVVERFTEKPDAATAYTYQHSGVHFWNAGIFMFRASTMLDELNLYAPEVATTCEQAVTNGLANGNYMRLSHQHFASSPSISIDYAIIEKSQRISMVEVDMGWSDIGSWEALWESGEKDAEENVVLGNVLLVDSRGCLVRNELDAPLAVADARDLVVVATSAGTLVMPRGSAQKAKLLSEELAKREEQ